MFTRILKRNVYLLIAFLLTSFYLTSIVSAQIDVDAVYSPEKNAYSGYKDPGEFAKMQTMKEAIDPGTGHVRLVATDLYLPGRNGLDLNINRIYNSNVWQDPGHYIPGDGPAVREDDMNGYYFTSNTQINRSTGELKNHGSIGLGWDIVMGEIQLYFLCSTNPPNHNEMCTAGELYFDDMSWIMLDDGVRHEISPSSSNSNTFRVKGKPGWKLELTTNIKYELTLENGTKYLFDRRYRAAPARHPAMWDRRPHARERFWLTKIEDTSGNYIDICYYVDDYPIDECGANSDLPPSASLTYRLISSIKDNLGRVVTFDIEKVAYQGEGTIYRFYVKGFTYSTHRGTVEVKYFQDRNIEERINYGYYRDPFFYNEVHNEYVTLLDSVAYFENGVQLDPATRYEYNTDFGYLDKVRYPNGGNISYDFHRVLFGQSDGQFIPFNYGYMRIRTKTVETPNADPETWTYAYGNRDRIYDPLSIEDDGTKYAIFYDISGSSVGKFGTAYANYLPNYSFVTILTPDEDYENYHYFDELDPQETPAEGDPLGMTSLVGSLDSVETYSISNEILAVQRSYYDHSYSTGYDYFDDFNSDYRKDVPIRLVGVMTELTGTPSNKIYFKDYPSFDDYGQPRDIREWGEVAEVSLWGQYAYPNGFNITDNTDGDYRKHEYSYLYEANYEYGLANILDRISVHSICDVSAYLLSMTIFEFDTDGHNLATWFPAEGGAPDDYWEDPLTNIRGNLTYQEILENNQEPLTYDYYYDPAGNIVKKVIAVGDDIFNKEITYEYEKSSNGCQRAYLTKYTIDPSGLNLFKIYGYWSQNGLPEGEKDYNGTWTWYTWDSMRRIEKINVEGGAGYNYLFDYIFDIDEFEYFKVIRTTNISPENKIEKYFVDALNRICQYQQIGDNDVIVTSKRYEYDQFVKTNIKPMERSRSQDDPYYDPDLEVGLDSTTYEYDAMGRTTTTDYSYVGWPNWPEERYFTQNSYNANEIIFADEDDNLTKFIMGARNVKSEILWGSNFENSTEFAYDPLDRLVRVENAIGQVDTFMYDMRGNIVASRITDHSDSSTFIYSPDGLPIFEQEPNRRWDPDFGWVYRKYDDAGRITEEGLLNIPGDCEEGQLILDNYVMLSVDPETDPLDETTISCAEDDVFEIEWQVDFNSGYPPFTGDGITPGILRSRYFEIINNNTGDRILRRSADGSGVISSEALCDDGCTYTARLYDDMSEDISWATLEWVCKDIPPIPECDPSYGDAEVWTKIYYYDSYDGPTAPPIGLDNPLGNLTKVVSRQLDDLSAKDSTIFYYDGRSRVGKKGVYLASTGIISKAVYYEYNETDLLTSIEYPKGYYVTYTYDEFGRVSSVGSDLDDDYYATLSYTPTHKVENMILNDPLSPAQTVDYEYNAERDWLTGINSGGVDPLDAGNGDHYSETITYYSGGYSGASFKNGNIASITNSYSPPHDNIDRLTQYDYDNRNRLLTSYTGTSSPYNESFNYEENGRITQYNRGGTAHDYSYHDNPNQTFNFNRVSQISGWSQSPGNYAFDYSGNMVADNEKRLVLTWDYRNLPIRADFGATNLQFRYDAEDNRVAKTFFEFGAHGADTTYYIWSDGNPIAEYYGDGSVKNFYIYANGQKIAHRHFVPGEICEGALNCKQDLKDHCTPYNCEYVPGDVDGDGNGPDVADLWYLINFLAGGDPPPPPMSRADVNCSGAVDGADATLLLAYLKGSGNPPVCCYYHCGMLYYHLNDHLGSTKVLVDSTGRMYSAYDYFATGDKTDLNWIYKGTNYQFTGKEYDDEAGFNMNYFGARYYDLKMGMFISIDPMASKNPGWSPYLYALDNPICYTDPDGRQTIREIKLSFRNITKARRMYRNFRKASQMARERRPGQPEADSPRDAFRHTLWSSMNARDFGRKLATEIGNTHELGSGDPAGTEMDFFNNEIGYKIGEENTNATDEELADIIEEAPLQESKREYTDDERAIGVASDDYYVNSKGGDPHQIFEPQR